MELDKDIVIKFDDGELILENIEARAWAVYAQNENKDVLEQMKNFAPLVKGSKNLTYKGEAVSKEHFLDGRFPAGLFVKVVQEYWDAVANKNGGAEEKNESTPASSGS